MKKVVVFLVIVLLGLNVVVDAQSSALTNQPEKKNGTVTPKEEKKEPIKKVSPQKQKTSQVKPVEKKGMNAPSSAPQKR